GNAEREEDAEKIVPGNLQLAIIGRPNVGKSSLVNALVGYEKAIVTDIAGTTRDAIDTELRYKNLSITLIDTAGLRKTARVKETIEFYSTVRTREAILRCHVAAVLVDATEGINEQDLHIIAEVAKCNKGLILAINKWDLFEKEADTARIFEKQIQEALRIYNYAPIIFISAVKGQRVFKLLDLALTVHAERQRELRTAELNEFLQEALQKYPPPSMDQREVKIKYCTQVKANPPVFAVFCNHPQSIRANYRQYLEKRFRAKFGFDGVPLTFSFRKK
ncbi:MAG: ribosome biogenesis GTPase Der, partial [candidate division KSB1 bacterium]